MLKFRLCLFGPQPRQDTRRNPRHNDTCNVLYRALQSRKNKRTTHMHANHQTRTATALPHRSAEDRTRSTRRGEDSQHQPHTTTVNYSAARRNRRARDQRRPLATDLAVPPPARPAHPHPQLAPSHGTLLTTPASPHSRSKPWQKLGAPIRSRPRFPSFELGWPRASSRDRSTVSLRESGSVMAATTNGVASVSTLLVSASCNHPP